MSELITLITATGGRQEAFKQCEKYMARQTVKMPIQWIIIDDCEPATPITLPFGDYDKTWIRQEYYRGPKTWRQGINTQRLNMDEAIKHIKGDYIFIIEDDDYYREDYLEAYVKLLQLYPVVGEGNAKYYNITERSWREWSNYQHASLCQTGFRKELIPVFDEAVNSGVLFMDCQLWLLMKQKGIKPFIFANQDYVIGMKGLPGRFGIGAGHQPQEQGFKHDPDYSMLKAWTGQDWHWYRELVQKIALARFKQK